MTIKEAQYFRDYIDSRLQELLSAMTKEEHDTLQGRRFADRFMQGITNQQELPQSVFRQFLEEIDFSEAKSLHDDLVKAQGQIEQALSEAEKVSDMESLHYTDAGGETKPFYIYIDTDDAAFNGLNIKNDEELWEGINTVLEREKSGNIQIVDLNIHGIIYLKRIYLYVSEIKIRGIYGLKKEYLWSVDGYYERSINTYGSISDWEWHGLDDTIQKKVSDEINSQMSSISLDYISQLN